MMPKILDLERILITGEDVTTTGSLQGDEAEAQAAQLIHSGDFEQFFALATVRELLGDGEDVEGNDYMKYFEGRVDKFSKSKTTAGGGSIWLLLAGVAALNVFVQSNVTGPPIKGDAVSWVLGFRNGGGWDRQVKRAIRESVTKGLSVEGEAVYHLIPDVVLFGLSKVILNRTEIEGLATGRWWRLRVNFWHQRMLEGGKTGLLHDKVYEDVSYLAGYLGGPEVFEEMRDTTEVKARFWVEKALVDTFFGYDKVALEGLEHAARLTGMEYALTGILGKRTKFQQTETSQLVVLAKSREGTEKGQNRAFQSPDATKPKTLDLNDDTLLESISFNTTTPSTTTTSTTATIQETSSLPLSLSALDPSAQPPLNPLDAAILLLLTETIKNTNPSSGITREEMAPYAERVLQHSTNWEVYTIGLLVRSRIEGYKSRTAERGLLQLQALVDQIIAETASAISSNDEENGASKKPTTFIPQANDSESAPVRERLQYVYQLHAPSRWELEAELAERWVALGGLRTALEIYERLEMWAEVALCFAATEREDKARKIIRNQLLAPVTLPSSWRPQTTTNDEPAEEYTSTPSEEATRTEITPPPHNAPRLWSILGDIDANPAFYERSWEVSGKRYARAKRSLGQYYFSKKDYEKSADAYAESLSINALHGQSWFALGCCRMEFEDWEGAVEAFSRCVSIDDEDAEAWSNLASALLRRRTRLPAQNAWKYSSNGNPAADDEEDEAPSKENNKEEGELVINLGRNRRDALKALKRASSLKYDSWRIWENLLIIAASIPEYTDVVIAMKRLIELRGNSQGESCVDVEILERFVRHVITTDLERKEEQEQKSSPTGPTTSSDAPTIYTEADAKLTQAKHLSKLAIDLVTNHVTPLITKDDRLWSIVAKLALWRNRPKEALEAHEKGFRAVSHGFDVGERKWVELVEAAVELASAYESLGEMEREGLASGGGEVVARDWRFKARSAVRTVMGRGRKEGREGGEEWERLEGVLEGLKV